MERVSLIATVYNEADSLSPWLASIEAQTRSPDEVVIVDAGSHDGTSERLLEWARQRPSTVVRVRPGLNISAGRNAAIEQANGPIICVCDAGTLLAPDWLEHLAQPLLGGTATGVSAGFFRPSGRTPFERVLATVITPRLAEIDPATFLPSSRSVAFHKKWWEVTGGYPEWLLTGEDLVFDLALKRAGAHFAFAPAAIAHWTPGPSLRSFFWQYWRYARGDGCANLWPRRHVARYGSYALGAVLLGVSRSRPGALAFLAAGAAIHLRRSCWRVLDERPLPGAIGLTSALALVPVIVITGDVAKMIGYPVGVWERLRTGGSHRSDARA